MPSKAAALSSELVMECNRHGQAVMDGSSAAVRAGDASSIAKDVTKLRQQKAAATDRHAAGGAGGWGGAGGGSAPRVEGRVLDDLEEEKEQHLEELRIKDPARWVGECERWRAAGQAGSSGQDCYLVDA